MTSPETTPRAALRAWTRLPALLLVAVALHQVWLAQREQLSPWSGGGFGMFSSSDFWARRHLHAFAVSPGLRRELEVPRSVSVQLRRTLALPSEARLRELGRQLAAELPAEDLAGARTLALSVYAVRYDLHTLAPMGLPLRSLRIPLDDTAR